jgi:hypothetical protein
MYYINTATSEYPITEGFIRAQFPNTSFVVPFAAPAPYAFVAESLKPEIPNPVIQTLKEFAPVLADGKWYRAWEVVSKFVEYTDSEGVTHTVAEQEAAAIAADQQANAQRIQNEIVAATQQRLDDFAKTRNYDGVLSLCTYASSPNPKFQAEGQYGVEARDATWTKLYEILAEVEAGTRPMPSGYADIEPELPPLVWPN